MMRKLPILCGLAMAALSTIAMAQSAASPAPAPYSSSTTQLGTLMADPAAKAVLLKDAPDLGKAGSDMEQANGMTLVEVAAALKAYAPNLLPPKVLAQIDEDLAKLPPPKN